MYPDPSVCLSVCLSYWRKRFSTIVQRCNAKVILRKLSKLSPNHGDLDRLFDFDIQKSSPLVNDFVVCKD